MTDILESIPSAQECADACAASAECAWFTHNSADSTCVLAEDCVFVDASCGECTYGQSVCGMC